MSRTARIVVPGFPHHIVQRGNRKACIFETDQDRYFYLKHLREYSQKYGLSIWAYCLMDNHVHLVAVPQVENAMASALHDAHTVYAMYFNTRTGLTGHLWQGRYYSTPMDETHLWAAVRYVELNPVRAGIVMNPIDYKWSSAAAHCGYGHDPLLSPDFPPVNAVENWEEWLADNPNDLALAEQVRKNTHTGRPSGSQDFIVKLENVLGRSLVMRGRGRPRNHKK